MADVPDADAGVTAKTAAPVIPSAAVSRLATYLHLLRGLRDRGATVVSSVQLSAAASVNSAILRKDLSYIGANGVRGVGYDVVRLITRISAVVEAASDHRIAVAGAAALGRVLVAHTGTGRGFSVVAMFDSDPALVGRRYSRSGREFVEVSDDVGAPAAEADEHIVIASLADIGSVCASRRVDVAVIATHDEIAQRTCDDFIAAGVRQILNVTTASVRSPDNVIVRSLDMGLELQMLAFDARRPASVPTRRPVTGCGRRAATAVRADTTAVRADTTACKGMTA